MFLTQIMIASYILLNIIVQIQALIQLPTIEDNSIAITETTIRNTVNSLFAAFKIPKIKNRTRLKQMSTIHNFFVSITLKDCKNLKEIARLSTVNNIDNGTQHFIARINEVLNEGDKRHVENDYEDNFNVTVYIEKFIEKLKHLKEAKVSNGKTATNSDILKHRYIKNNHFNITSDNIVSSRKDEKKSGENLLDDNEFWQPSARRIYQGIRTKIKTFPFVASVHFFTQFQCAGSIIENDLVITSASCLQIAWNNRYFRLNPTFLSVIVGCDFYERCGDDIAVVQIFFHPQYDPKTLKHNLAIMRLSRTINFRRSHGRVRKILFDNNPAGMPVNKGITIVGWGAKDITNTVYNAFKNKLSYRELDFIPLDDCQQHYSKEYVTHKHFCAGFYTKGGGACSHDAGGPGIIDNVLMGVVSFGSPECGAPDVPTVFTKLGFYSDWIEDIVHQANVLHQMRTSTVYEKEFTIADILTTTKLKIYPVEIATFKPIVRSEKESHRVAQEQRFDDYMSTMLSTDYIADNSATTASEATNKTQKASYDYDISEVALTTVSTTPVPNMSPKDNSNLKNQNITFSMASNTDSEGASVGDKTLEEDIIAFIDNLDIEKLLPSVPQDSSLDIDQNSTTTTTPFKSGSPIEESVAQENKTSTKQREDMSNKHNFLKSLFFSGESSNSSENDTMELSTGD